MGLCCSSKGVTLLYVELLSKLCETIFALLDTPSAAPSVRFWRPATTFSSVSCAVPWQHGSGTSCSAVQTTMPAALGAGSSADEFWRGLEGARRVSLYGISRGPAAGPPEAGIFRAQGAIIEPDPWVLIRLVFASTDIFVRGALSWLRAPAPLSGGKKVLSSNSICSDGRPGWGVQRCGTRAPPPEAWLRAERGADVFASILSAEWPAALHRAAL